MLSKLQPDSDHGSPADWVKVTLESYGLPIVETGCDATLTVRLDMFALAEIYENAGQCYPGYNGLWQRLLINPSPREDETDGDLHTRDSIALTAFYLNSPDAQARQGAGQFATYLAQTHPDRLGQLDPLVPYLISALEKAIDAEPFGDGDPYNSALRAITGEDIAPTAARWWDWWQANS